MKKFTGFAAALLCAAMSFSLLSCENPASSSSDPEPASQNGNSTPAATTPAPTPAPATYTVTYADGIDELEISVPSDTAQHSSGSTVTVNFTVGNRLGYTFAGWSDGTNTYTSNGTSSFTISSNVTLTAQWQASWPNSYIGTKAPSETKEVGDIVFNDNSAMSYSDFSTRLVTADKNSKKTSAIALIFYKGTELNSGSDTTTSRTLGVGLKHSETAVKWCPATASTYNVEISDIYCKPSGNQGAYTFNDATCNDRNGKDNFDKVKTAIGNNNEDYDTYEALYWACSDYINHESRLQDNTVTSTLKTSWFLPSIAELFWIYKNGKGANKIFDIDAASETLGGNRLDAASLFWSSTQVEPVSNGSATDITRAYVFGFSNGGWDCLYKESSATELKVCAIREFN